MCGIGGIVRFAGGVERHRERLVRVRDSMRHRGPDGDGVFVSTRAGLVHTRLALVDPEGGAQPLHSPDGRYVLVYNGEVYNAAELRNELDWTFRTRCDAEVVLAAYVRWGAGCVHRFNGMFAFFVWDTQREEGFAARDLLGVKPFVYARTDEDDLVFASEAKAVLAALPGRPRASTRALLEYLVVPCFSGVEAPMFDGLHYLPPGHTLSVTRAGVTVERWGAHDLRDPADDVTAARLHDALTAAVQRTTIADAPVGVFLSGGLDSTAIAAHARLPAFTIQFEEQHAYDYTRSRIVTSDDGPFASLAARELGLSQTIVPVARASLADDLRTIAANNDALPAWEQELAQHHLARAAGATCKAVLVGDAADETHYGYHFLLDAQATASPRGIIERFGAPLLDEHVAYFDRHYRSLAESAGHSWDTPDARVLATTWLVVHRWLPRLLHNGDIHGMAHSLEARVPFADIELLALARRIGPRTGLANGIEKALLRESLRGLIPDAIRTRKKSALPKDQHVAAIYQQEAAPLLDELAPIIDVARTRELLHREIDERERAFLFRLICLSHWMHAYEVRL